MDTPKEPRLLTTSVPFPVVVDPQLDPSKVRLGWPMDGSGCTLYIGAGASLTEGEIAAYAEAIREIPTADHFLAVAAEAAPGKKFPAPAGGTHRRRRKPRRR